MEKKTIAIPIGIEFYKEMHDKEYYYVDKTMMIKDLLDNTSSVTLFTRPRRFGKTLALNMLKTFFEDERDPQGNKVDNRKYFEKKKIAFIRSLFESAVKTNESLEFAVITGCLRISRESIFTGLNNLDVNTVLNRNHHGA